MKAKKILSSSAMLAMSGMMLLSPTSDKGYTNSNQVYADSMVQEQYSDLAADAGQELEVSYQRPNAAKAAVTAKAVSTKAYTLKVSSGKDITTALQKAIDDGYTDIVIPKGTYTCSGISLNEAYGVTISAEGATIKQAGKSQPLVYVSNSHEASDIVIDGGVWDGNNGSMPVFRFYGDNSNITIQNAVVQNSKDAGIRMRYTQTATMENVTVKNHSSYGVIFDQVKDISVSKSTFTNNKVGINMDGCKGSNQVVYSTCTNNKDAGIRFIDGSEITLNYNEVHYNNGQGISLENVSDLVSMKGNNSKNNDKAGIRIVDCPGKIAFSRNYAYYNGDSGVYLNGCKGIITLYKTNAKYNEDCGFEVIDCANIKVSGCSVKLNKNYGINMDGNTKTDAYKWAINIIDTNVSSNGNIGIRIVDTVEKKNIEDTTVTSNDKSGFYASNCGSLILNTVTASKNGEYGFNVNKATSLTAVSCLATDNKDTGLFLNDTTGASVSDSEFSENGAHGVYVVNSEAKLNTVSAKENYWCGVSASGKDTDLRVNEGTYYGNGTRPDKFEGDDNLCAGIGVYDGATATITEAVCNNNHGCGITAAGSEDGKAISTISVYGCTTQKNGDHGIGGRPYAKINVKASSSGKANVIQNNKNTGFILNDHCTTDYVMDCTISGNGKAGISISEHSEAALIQDNSIYDNDEDGIHVSENSEAVIKDCSITENKLSGIGVYSNSKVDIDDCVVNTNKHYGICIDDSVATKIKDGKVQYNSWAGVIVRKNGEIKSLNDVDIYYNKSYGLYCGEGGKATVTKCSIKYNESDGVRVTGKNSSAAITSTKMMYNEGNGLVATDSGKVTSVKKGHASGNKGYGVYCANNGRVTMNGVSVEKNGKDGVRVTGASSKVKITDGKINDNKKNGLVVTSSGLLNGMSGTSITNNSKHGIAVYKEGTTVNVKNITTSGNDNYEIYVEKGADTSLKSKK